MQSGCPHSQGGAYPAFQHRINVGSLTSPLNSVTPAPVIHHANGIQNTMVATQYSEELRVAYGLAQSQNARSQQQIQHHRLESQASVASTGLQDPKSFCACTPHADFYSSAHVSAQHSSHFGTSATGNSVRQSVNNGGKPRENFNGLVPKVSHLNNTGLQQTQYLRCALSAYTSSAAHMGDGLGIASQTFPSERNANIELTANLSDKRHCKSQQMKTSLVALNCGETRTQNLNYSGRTRSTPHQQQISSPSLSSLQSTEKVSPVGETEPPTDDQILNLITEKCAHFRAILTQKNRYSGHAQSNKKWDFCTNDRDSTLRSDGIMPKSSVAHLPATSFFPHLLHRRQSLNYASIEDGSAALGQAFEEGSEANAELTPNSKETGDCSTSASKTHSTEYLQVMMKVGAACAKNEDESPVDELTEKKPSVMLNYSSSQEYMFPLLNTNKNLDDIDQVPGVSWTLKHMPEKMDIGLKPVVTVGLDDVHGVTQTKSNTVVSENKQTTSHIENQDANTKTKKNLEDQQRCGVICEEVMGHSNVNSSVDNILIHNVASVVTNQSEWLCNQTSCEDARNDQRSVHSQTNISTALSENKVTKQNPLSESKGEEALCVNVLKAPQYDDISDSEDMSELAKNHEELTFPAGFEDPQYEDISEDEKPQTENVSACCCAQASPQSPGNGHVQGQAQKTKIIAYEVLIPKTQISPKTKSLDIEQHCSCSHFVETDDGFEGLSCSKCDRERHLGCQTNRPVSCGSVLKDEDESDDDDWIVIPINISDLKLESDDEDGPEIVDETGDNEQQCDISLTHQELYRSAPKPVRASAFSQIEVFDTVESFRQAKVAQFKVGSGRTTAEHEMDSEGEPHIPKKRQESSCESEDSCETEDSCDYSSGSERNYLTVPRELLQRSAPLPPKTDDSASEKEGEDGEIKNVQKGQTRSSDKFGRIQKLRQLVEASPKQHTKISKKDDSDSENENDQNCKKKAKRKRSFSSVSEDSEDASCSHQKKRSPETGDRQCGAVKERFPKNRLPSADSPAPLRQAKRQDTQFKEEIEIAFSDLSHSTEKSRQQIEAKAGSENVQHEVNRQKISPEVIIIDSDSEDDQNRTANRSRSAYGGDAPCVQQNRHSSETVDCDYGTANERLQETRLSTADSSLPQYQAKLHDTQSKEVMQGECSDLSHSIKKNGQLIELKGSSELGQHKNNRQTTKPKIVTFRDSDKVFKKDNFSRRNMTTKSIYSSGSEDSSDALFSAQNRPSTETVGRLCGTANKKPEKNKMSSDDSPEKQPRCVDEDADSTLCPNHSIPRLVVEASSPPNDHLKLLKESRVHRQGKDETGAPKPPTATRSNAKIRLVSKLKPANDGHYASQANVTNRRVLLPSLEGPSTSISSLCGQLSETTQSSSFSRGVSQTRETSTSSRLAKSKQSTSFHRPHVPNENRSHSYSNTSTKGKSSSVTMQSEARKKVIEDWQTLVPIKPKNKTSLGMEEDLGTLNQNLQRVDRPLPSHYGRSARRRYKSSLGMEEDSGTLNQNLQRDNRPGPSQNGRPARQRQNSHESATPLMKKTKIDARQWTKAINRETPREQRPSVGEGYKWSEKPTTAKPTKAPSREGKKY